MEINQILYGFRITEIRESEELGGRGVRMEHTATGARLFWLDNGAENKVFSIAFRTIPEDDTGVFHILEHSVLCGSERFPVREPFVELLKSSMSTFLNAITFQDMTMYPVSSRNPKDLLNLTEVYLDAVFAPVCEKEEKVFRQEGWHLEEDGEGRPVFKGVVYNEMKGAMSDTDTLIDHRIMKQLFPDTGYGCNSGGDPEIIPELTWEKFREQYRKHYHPSNAWIYLDGDVPLEELLALTDSYLSRYERREDFDEFRRQEPVSSEETIRYELGQEETPENKGYLTASRIVGTWEDRAENQARSIICDVLTGNNESPLKRAALERNLAQDLSLSVDDTGYQSWITMHAERITDGKEQEILNLLRETGETVLREGIDRKAAEASLNRLIFNLREEDEPQGIGRCIRSMNTWLYGGHPLDALESGRLILRLREMLEDGSMDRLAADMLLNREGTAVLHTLPSHTLGEEKRAAEEERARRMAEARTEEEKAHNDRMLEILDAWQQAPDSEEALQTLPSLSLSDADVAPKWTETEETETAGVRLMTRRMNCNGIVYIRIYFRLTDCSLEELTRADFLASLLGKLSTAKRDARSLQEEIKRCTGGFGVLVQDQIRTGERDSCTPLLIGSLSALQENARQAEELLAEVLTSTRLDETDKILELVQQADMNVRQRVVRAGQSVGIRQALSSYSADGAVRNALEGAPAARYIHAFAAHPEEELPRLRELAERLLGKALGRKRMTVSYTGDEVPDCSGLIARFPEGTEAPERTAYPLPPAVPTGFRIPAQIGFAVQGYRLSEMGLRFTGSMWLAANILSLEILWNRVRVQGGAYGSGMSVDRHGNLLTYSFRDPTPGRSLEVNRELAESIRTFADSGEKPDRYIISSLNELNPLLSPRERSSLADYFTLTGYTREDAERIRREVLQTTPDDLKACAEWLEKFAANGTVCVVAHQEALARCPGLEISEI